MCLSVPRETLVRNKNAVAHVLFYSYLYAFCLSLPSLCWRRIMMIDDGIIESDHHHVIHVMLLVYLSALNAGMRSDYQ